MVDNPVYGPYAVEIKVQIINDESGQRGDGFSWQWLDAD